MLIFRFKHLLNEGLKKPCKIIFVTKIFSNRKFNTKNNSELSSQKLKPFYSKYFDNDSKNGFLKFFWHKSFQQSRFRVKNMLEYVVIRNYYSRAFFLPFRVGTRFSCQFRNFLTSRENFRYYSRFEGQRQKKFLLF